MTNVNVKWSCNVKATINFYDDGFVWNETTMKMIMEKAASIGYEAELINFPSKQHQSIKLNRFSNQKFDHYAIIIYKSYIQFIGSPQNKTPQEELTHVMCALNDAGFRNSIQKFRGSGNKYCVSTPKVDRAKVLAILFNKINGKNDTVKGWTFDADGLNHLTIYGRNGTYHIFNTKTIVHSSTTDVSSLIRKLFPSTTYDVEPILMDAIIKLDVEIGCRLKKGTDKLHKG